MPAQNDRGKRCMIDYQKMKINEKREKAENCTELFQSRAINKKRTEFLCALIF